jgi:DNA-binding NarL/FixJ family response regulator
MADTLRAAIGARTPSHREAGHDNIVTTLRAALGEAAYGTALAAGRVATFDEALAEARLLAAATAEPARAPRGRTANAHGLTGRELEILALIVAGQSNREIGEQIFISSTTVARHVANIFSKLGVDSRAQAATFAHRHGLV